MDIEKRKEVIEMIKQLSYFFDKSKDRLCAPYGLSSIQSKIIIDVFHNEGSRITDICKRLNKETNTISPLINRLINHGYLNKVVNKYMSEYEENIKKLEKIPGIGRTSAQVILAEIGQDMNQFPTAGHLASWAGVCPGNNESAGKRRNGKTRKGNKILKSTLVQCANASKRHKDSFYHAQYQRILVRRGKKRATVAVAHSILISIYYMIKYDKEYNELGAQFYNQFNTEKKINSYIRKLHELGVDVHVDTSLLKT